MWKGDGGGGPGSATIQGHGRVALWSIQRGWAVNIIVEEDKLSPKLKNCGKEWMDGSTVHFPSRGSKNGKILSSNYITR